MQPVLKGMSHMETNQIEVQLHCRLVINQGPYFGIFQIIQVSVWRAFLLSQHPPKTEWVMKGTWSRHKNISLFVQTSFSI